VTIEGDGFMPNNTRLFIGNANYMSFETITYSQIIFTTLQPTMYVDQNLPLTVFVGTNQAICVIPSCYFCWATSITPQLDSVTPLLISGPSNLNFIGQNLLSGGGTYIDAHLYIGGSPCIVTGMTNDTMNCSIDGAEAGNYQTVGGFINGLSLL
jgi:hypothetical protein